MDSLHPACSASGTSATVQTDRKLTVFPNPNSGIFSVRYPEGFEGKPVVIRDGFGRMVWKSDSETNEIRTTNLASGHYWVCVAGLLPHPIEIR
jgi:hypothetical protein